MPETNPEIELPPKEETEFTNWQRLLAGEKLAIDVNEPWTGYYKTRGRDGRFLPVAFWRKHGKLRCRIDDAEIPPDRAVDIWPFAANAPVSYEDYNIRINTGKWPSESEAVINHNLAPPQDSIEAISERIADLAREAETLIKAGPAKDQAAADQASDLANLFGELEKKANTLRTQEKAPILEVSRQIDKKWNVVISRAGELKIRLKGIVLTPFFLALEKARQQAAATAIAQGTAPEALPDVKASAGSSKRTTALRTQKRAEITDWPALMAHLHDHPEMKETAQRIANASARTGIELPGMKIVSERVAA